MSSTVRHMTRTEYTDEPFLAPVSAEVLAARKAKRDYIMSLCVAMITPIVLLAFAALLH